VQFVGGGIATEVVRERNAVLTQAVLDGDLDKFIEASLKAGL
jgi:hypothetical protein